MKFMYSLVDDADWHHENERLIRYVTWPILPHAIRLVKIC